MQNIKHIESSEVKLRTDRPQIKSSAVSMIGKVKFILKLYAGGIIYILLKLQDMVCSR